MRTPSAMTAVLVPETLLCATFSPSSASCLMFQSYSSSSNVTSDRFLTLPARTFLPQVVTAAASAMLKDALELNPMPYGKSYSNLILKLYFSENPLVSEATCLNATRKVVRAPFSADSNDDKSLSWSKDSKMSLKNWHSMLKNGMSCSWLNTSMWQLVLLSRRLLRLTHR